MQRAYSEERRGPGEGWPAAVPGDKGLGSFLAALFALRFLPLQDGTLDESNRQVMEPGVTDGETEAGSNFLGIVGGGG